METEVSKRRVLRARFKPRAVIYLPWDGTLEHYSGAFACARRVREEWELPRASSIASVYVCVANYPVRGAIAAPCYAWASYMLDVSHRSHVWWWVEYELKEGSNG